MISMGKLCGLSVLVLYLAATNTMAQTSEDFVVKQFTDKSLGGECILEIARLSAVGNTVSKTFQIETPESGDYYVHSWSMGFNSPKGLHGYEVYVDDNANSSGVMEASEARWGSVELVSGFDKTPVRIHLTSGQHKVSFKCEAPYTPAIDFIRLARDESRAIIPDGNYRKFADFVKSSKLPLNYAQLKHDSFSGSLKKVVNNPEGDYVHDLGIGFSYTYYETFYWASAGSIVTFETKKSDPYASDPVMFFFNAEDPVNKRSKSNDDGGQGCQAKMTDTIPYAGYYILLLQSYNVGTSGTSDLYLNDNLFASDVPLTHAGAVCNHTDTSQLNYFTTHLTGDSRIWIEDQYGAPAPGLIRAYNDDFSGPGDFAWGYNARVRQSLSMPIRATRLSAFSSSNPTGSCDLYMKCGSTGSLGFPDLDAADAIRSAPASEVYHCLDWTGGITSTWEWPPNVGSRYIQFRIPMTHQDTLASFDNYYGNKQPDSENSLPRYSGAWSYTSTGANSGNNLIDLWAGTNGVFGHASIYSRWDNIPSGDPANAHPHGYDWESKDTNGPRFFHPRYALGGNNGYGSPARYYKLPEGFAKKGIAYKTSTESIAGGLSVLESVALTASELAWIDSLKKTMAGRVLQDFDTKYVAWKKTWTDPRVISQCDPRRYAQSKEYFEFLEYCLEQGKSVFPLLLERLNSGDSYVIVPLEDLTFRGNEKMMEEVHKENLNERYTKEGAYLIHGLLGNWMIYGKKLLAQYETYPGFSPPCENLNSSKPEPDERSRMEVQSYPNPFNPSTQIRYYLPSGRYVSVRIYDLIGKEVAVITNNELQLAGWHIATWNARGADGASVSSGVYFCKVRAGEDVHTTRLVLIR
jgi:hypothetical protein